MRKLLLAMLLATPLFADSVELFTEITHSGKVLSQDDSGVAINTFNSTMKEMTWGVKRFTPDIVRKVTITPPDPLREFWFRKCDPQADPGELLKWCLANNLDVEAKEEALNVLERDGAHPEARAVLGGEVDAILRASPRHNAALRQAAADFAALDVPARAAAYARFQKDWGVTLPQLYFERVARSLAQPKGVVTEDLRLTYNTQKASGRYTTWVPKSYDPHRSYPLILALHGTWNGFGGIGNGRDFVRHFTYAETAKWDVIIASPTADPRPWTAKGDDFVLTVLAEMQLLYNIDLNRIYVIGHSMGGGGTWHFGTKYPEKFAAFAPAAAAGSGKAMDAAAQGTGMYIYHSSDDKVASCERARLTARTLRDAEVDFVYTEWTDQGHGWPQAVIADAFLYFRRHHRMEKGPTAPVPCRGIRPSFAEPAYPDEAKYFMPAREAGGKTELADLLGEIELGGLVAEKAANRLLELKDKRAVAPLAKLLGAETSCDDTRIECARVLSAVKDPAAAAAVLKALADPVLKVRIAAAETLALVGAKKDAIALATAIMVITAEFEKLVEKSKWINDETWAQYHTLNAALVHALAELGDPRTWTAASDHAIQKILLTEAKSGSEHIDPEPVRRASCLRILKALPAFKEPKLKAVVTSIRDRFHDVKEICEAADKVSEEIGGLKK